MTAFINTLGGAALTVVLSFLVLAFVVRPPQIEPTSRSVGILGTTRHLSYEIAGDPKRPNCIIWLHGLLSSRYETLPLKEEILQELDAFVVSFDRPGYGESSPHTGRTFESAVEDIDKLVDALGVPKYFVAGVSAGGSFALATASLKPDRLRGVLLLSAVGSQGTLTEEAAEEEAARRQKLSLVFRFLVRAFVDYPWSVTPIRWLAESYAGGRAIYSLWLEGAAKAIVSRMVEADARCVIRQPKSHYTTKVVPESLKQATATATVQDMLLVLQPWSFNVSDIPKKLEPSIHIWHGTNDPQVHVDYAYELKKRLPAANLQVVDGGGHFAYWVCDAERQRLMLKALIDNGQPA